MDKTPNQANFVQQYQPLLVGLLALSILLPLWHHHGMNSIFVVDASSSLEVVATDDRWQGGKSVAVVQQQEDSVKLDCAMSNAYQWPYCEAVYKLATNESPLDLSHFDFMRVRIHSQGPGPQNVKLYLRHYDAAYTTIENDTSLKVNQIEFDPNKESFPVDIPLSNFTVAPWWINSMQLSSLEETTEFTSIVHLDVSTGGFRQPGQHEIIIHGLEFHGKWITYGQLVTLLLCLWAAGGVSVLLHSLYLQRRKASQVALGEDSVDSALESQELREARAQKDYLTGAYNRLGLRQFMIELVSMHRRKNQSFVVCLFQINKFDQLEAAEGPAVCDALLQTLAQIVSDETRETDILGRWSSERFILLCANSSAASTKALTEKLKLKIASTQWPSALDVSCIFGLAEINDGEDVGQVIRRAEDDLSDNCPK